MRPRCHVTFAQLGDDQADHHNLNLRMKQVLGTGRLHTAVTRHFRASHKFLTKKVFYLKSVDHAPCRAVRSSLINKALGGGFIVTNLVVTLPSMTSLEQAFHWKTQGQGILYSM